MIDYIKDLLSEFNIDLVSCISLDECEIKRDYLLKRHGIDRGSVIIFAVPYLSKECLSDKNISAYAVPRDYHLFFGDLFASILPKLKERYPENTFAGFTDHSPIDEISAASRAGLGVIGKNHLLITEKYSSYIFIGEIITDAELPSHSGTINTCISCGKCLEACPVSMDISKCLSALNQRKGELSSDEITSIYESKCAWGCDICQEICPYTKKAIDEGTIFTKTEFFNVELIPTLSVDSIESMSDEEFKRRAYSWRGKAVIKRNLEILEGKES